jgi:hypothetical protein
MLGCKVRLALRNRLPSQPLSHSLQTCQLAILDEIECLLEYILSNV